MVVPWGPKHFLYDPAVLTPIFLIQDLPYFANSADPVQMASEGSTVFTIQFVIL